MVVVSYVWWLLTELTVEAGEAASYLAKLQTVEMIVSRGLQCLQRRPTQVGNSEPRGEIVRSFGLM